MDRIRRNERLAAMTRILVESPNKIFTLGTFCELFGAAKSTVSEDLDALRKVTREFDLGEIEKRIAQKNAYFAFVSTKAVLVRKIDKP